MKMLGSVVQSGGGGHRHRRCCEWRSPHHGRHLLLLARKECSNDLKATLTGYLRMGGSLNILGLTETRSSSSCFTYDSETDKAYGRATLTVHVEVLFFSASVELTVGTNLSVVESEGLVAGGDVRPAGDVEPDALAFA